MSVEQREVHFWDRGCQYYIAGRFAVTGALNPIAGNLLHHAIEFLLKGALAKTRTLTQLRQLGHKLPPTWEEFKAEVGDIGIARFDATIAALHAYEDIRYPDDALKNGMESMITSHRIVQPPVNPSGTTLPQVKRYDLCLQDVDELAEAIFSAAKRNPRFFFSRLNPKSQDILRDGNLAPGLLK